MHVTLMIPVAGGKRHTGRGAGVTQSLVSQDGSVTQAAAEHTHITEPLDCDRVANYNSAGIALNPFGNSSDLDGLIFDGFTPHESLKTRW